MTQSKDTNRQIVLAQRPIGAPNADTLRLENSDVPVAGAGEMLLRTEYLSLDPYMRGRMNDAKSYAEPVKIGEEMTGQVVAEVMVSNIDKYEPGDYVLARSGWQDYAISDGLMVVNLGKDPQNPSWSLGILGMPGYTAYAGLLKIGEPKPGETVVVAAASGPVALQAVRTNAPMSSITSALMRALITRLMILPSSLRQPAPMALTSILKMLAARCFMVFFLCLIRLPACRSAAW